MTVSGHRLDPRQPLVVDTHELGRRPGSMRRVTKTVPAPENLGTPVAQVPPGSDIVLDLRLESVMEGVLVTGTAQATLSGECGRCLEPVTDELEVDLQELFVYSDERLRGKPGSGSHNGAGVADEDEEPKMVEDLFDLEPTLRDALVLEMPLTPLCNEDCGGLCAGCGARLDDVEPDHSHELADPRWAALAQLRTSAAGTTEEN
ncbi:MAG: hypothetical protein QOJ32_2562 [Frankiaceae bacterium]|nr:hypothetical protein [Frankiaceae bacterium]